MENYEELSSTFKVMLKRTKVMRVRLKILRKKINEILSEPVVKYVQFRDMQLEYDGISVSLEYIGLETKRTIIMLKICLYKQKNGNISTTNNSVEQNSTSIHDHKATLIPIIESRHHNEVQNYNIPSECESDFGTWETQVHDSKNWILSTITDTKLLDQRSLVNFKNCSITFSKFTDERNIIRVGIGPMKPDTARAVYIITFFCILRNYFNIPELEKIKCKIKW